MRKRSPLFPAPPTMKMNTDIPPKTQSNEELLLLKKILIEAKQFRKPPSENGKQPDKAKRGVQKKDQPGRRGAV
jgi:hypothetical protein